MLLPVEVTPRAAATFSVFQFTAPFAYSEPAPVVAVSVLPVIVLPAVSDAERLAATEPCVVTRPAVTVCARMKPLLAVTLMSPAMRVDGKSVVEGKCVDLGGRGIIKNKNLRPLKRRIEPEH